jgi:two-component system, OmpR family, response regulator
MAIQQSSQYIFLVDDEPIQNEMLKDYLSERFHYKIKTYSSGEDMVKDMNLNPAIIVLDFHLNAHLPNAQNGVDILKKIKEMKSSAQVIMLSGQDKLDVAVSSMKYGAYDYVIKGETAFSRMENIINNINELDNIKAANSTYKKIVVGLCVVIAFILVLSGYLIKKLGT